MKKVSIRFWLWVIILLLIFLFASGAVWLLAGGCASSQQFAGTSTTAGNFNTSTSSTMAVRPTLAPYQALYAYVAGVYHNSSSDWGAEILAYNIDPVSGKISQLPGITYPNTRKLFPSLYIDNGYLYLIGNVLNFPSPNPSTYIEVFKIDTTNGSLTSEGFEAVSDFPNQIAFDGAGNFACFTHFWNNPHQVSSFSIGAASGLLAPFQSIQVGSSSNDMPSGIAIHPSGKYVYISHNNYITVYDANPINGAIGGVLFDTDVGILAQPGRLLIDSSGQLLLAYEGFNQNMDIYKISSNTGALTPAGSEKASTGSWMSGIDGLARFLYIDDSARLYSYYLDFYSGAGALLASGEAQHATLLPDPSGRFMLTNSTNEVISYGIDLVTGGLSLIDSIEVAGSPDIYSVQIFGVK